MLNSNNTDGIRTWKGTSGLLLDELFSQVPEVQLAVATTDVHEFTMHHNKKPFKASGLFASKQFFEVFTYPFYAGEHQADLTNPDHIIITRSLARRVFGNSSDVIGQSITWTMQGQSKTFEVAGVIENPPEQTSEPFEFILPWTYYHDDLIDFKGWGNFYARTRVVLNPAADIDKVNAQITAIQLANIESDNISLFLTSYSNRYLYNKYENGKAVGGRIDYVVFFIIIAGIVLFMACINFINLSTALASHRLKEIGVRKTMGALRQSIAAQFLTESVLMALFSLFIALVLTIALLPWFNDIAQKSLTLSFSVSTLALLVGTIITVGLLSGFYPAVYLSRFGAIEGLRGLVRNGKTAWFSRNALVLVQFTISVILIVTVITVRQQMAYILNKDLGYNKDNIIYLMREGTLTDNYEAFLAEARKLPTVAGAALSSFFIGGDNSTFGVDWPGKPEGSQTEFWETRAGHGLIELLEMQLVAGRTFSKDFGDESNAVVFNETAIKAMGMDDPLGKTIDHYTGKKTIIGVVKDFNLESLHTAVAPNMFLFAPEKAASVMVRFKPGQTAQGLAAVQRLHEALNPGYPFNASFFDQTYAQQYQAEQRTTTLLTYFGGFAMLITALGLFGLMAFTIQKKLKEIGIRKVLGATVLNIIGLLTSNFIKIVIVACLLAVPISYIANSNWLSSYAYHINIQWWYFAAGILFVVLFTVAMVSVRVARAAVTNPTHFLRNE